MILCPVKKSSSASFVALKFLPGKYKHDYVTYDSVRHCLISSHAYNDSLLFVKGKSVIYVVPPEFQVREKPP